MKTLKVTLKLTDEKQERSTQVLIGDASEAERRGYILVTGWGVAGVLGEFRHEELQEIKIEPVHLEQGAESGGTGNPRPDRKRRTRRLAARVPILRKTRLAV